MPRSVECVLYLLERVPLVNTGHETAHQNHPRNLSGTLQRLCRTSGAVVPVVPVVPAVLGPLLVFSGYNVHGIAPRTPKRKVTPKSLSLPAIVIRGTS
ncbi:unnamed protein product [Sphagnum jensenii]|uniref:Uncharacterized protein n=2 Tax=Sphagnum jensenii TaxID=128206 RepID=A0ABP0VI85_9BRYO